MEKEKKGRRKKRRKLTSVLLQDLLKAN